jgi:OFA family oxalate/formate antiporter-like MFS transporter
MSDHIGRLNTLRVVLLLSGIAMPLLFLNRQDVTLFYIFLSIVYYCYGAQFSVYPALSADLYGTKNMGLNYGLLLLAWGAAGVLGPMLGGQIYVATGQYQWAFYVAAILSFVAVAVLFAAKKPAHSSPGSAGH